MSIVVNKNKFVTFSKTSVPQVRYSENLWIVYRYLIEAIQVCTIQIDNLIFCSLFGASFMLIACSEVKISKKKNECYLHGYGAMFSM